MPADLTGQVVLITGASSGIGAACALAFAKQGCRLVLTARRLERLEELRRKLKEEHSVRPALSLLAGTASDRMWQRTALVAVFLSLPGASTVWLSVMPAERCRRPFLRQRSSAHHIKAHVSGHACTHVF